MLVHGPSGLADSGGLLLSAAHACTVEPAAVGVGENEAATAGVLQLKLLEGELQ